MLFDATAASALLFAGLTSVALSPAVVLLATVVLHHNDLILLAIGSAFVWLLAITVCASLWWATASLGDGSRLVLAVLFGAPVQEASRWLTYALYLRLLRGLHSRVEPLPPAVVSLHAMAPGAVANGVGIGLMQTLVMSGDTATRSLLPGSLYTDACASLSLFAVNALCALGTRSRLETAPAPATAPPDRLLDFLEGPGRACSLEPQDVPHSGTCVRNSLSWAHQACCWSTCCSRSWGGWSPTRAARASSAVPSSRCTCSPRPRRCPTRHCSTLRTAA
jgi:hypothetical protein